ncbi:Uncharacterized protein QTN25_001586 [Entamoeba marina]
MSSHKGFQTNHILQICSYLNFRTLLRFRCINKKFTNCTRRLTTVNIFDIDGARFIKSNIVADTINALPTITPPTSNHQFQTLDWLASIPNNAILTLDYAAVLSPKELSLLLKTSHLKELELVLDVATSQVHQESVKRIVKTFPTLNRLLLSIDPGDGQDNQINVTSQLSCLTNLTSLQIFTYHHQYTSLTNLQSLNFFINSQNDYQNFISDLPMFCSLTNLTFRMSGEDTMTPNNITKLTSLYSLKVLNLSKIFSGYDTSLSQLTSIYGIQTIYLKCEVVLHDDFIKELCLFPPIFKFELTATIDGTVPLPTLYLPTNVVIGHLSIQNLIITNPVIDFFIVSAESITTNQAVIDFVSPCMLTNLSHLENSENLKFDNCPLLKSVLLCGEIGDDVSTSLTQLKYLKDITFFECDIYSLSFLNQLQITSLRILHCVYPPEDIIYIKNATSLNNLVVIVPGAILTQSNNAELVGLTFLQTLRTTHCTIVNTKASHPFKIEY